jgi:RHS repeat-associated protein
VTDLAVVFDASGNVSHRYLYGGSIDEVLSDDNSTGINWSLADLLGTVDLIVDDQGAVIDRVTFDSFGNKVSESAPDKAFRFGFTGRELDPETGLYYYRARYYDPLVGRFISVDSIGFQAGDTNLYRYVFNSPTLATDPTGHEWWDELGQNLGNAWNGAGNALQSAWNTTQDVAGRVADGAGYWGELFRPAADDLSDTTRRMIDNVARNSFPGMYYNYVLSPGINLAKKIGGAIYEDWEQAGRDTTSLEDRLVFTADKFIAGVADGATLGATTRLRESIYGDKIKSQHQGAIFTTGQVVGIAAVTIVSGGTATTAKATGRALTLAERILVGGVKTGLSAAPIAGVSSAGMSILHDIDKGKLFDGGAFDRALEAGVEGAIGGFKFGAELGGAGVLGLPGKAWQTKLLVEGAAGSVNKAIDHFKKEEYFSGAGELLNALLAAKDAGKHTGEFVADAQGAYQSRRNRGAETVGAQPHGLPIGETTRIPGVELSPEAPVHPRELPHQIIPDPWLEPVADRNRSIEFPNNSNRSPYAEISDPWKTQCFIAGTKIITRDGTKNIEDIRVGDWVLSDDPNTPGEVIYKQVLQTFEKETGTTIDIFIDGEKITTTEEHPFWVPDVGWVAAKDLQAGTHLQTKYESWLDVDKVDRHLELTKVYNFEVEGFHTYFVSDLGFLVHNECNGSRKLEVFRANDRYLENKIFDETGVNSKLKCNG